MRRITNSEQLEAFVPQDSTEVFMLDFVAVNFTGSERLKAKTNRLMQNVIQGDTMPELEQFIGDDEAELIITGLKHLVAFAPCGGWRQAQAALMLAEYYDPTLRARSLAALEETQIIADYEKEFQV